MELTPNRLTVQIYTINSPKRTTKYFITNQKILKVDDIKDEILTETMLDKDGIQLNNS